MSKTIKIILSIIILLFSACSYKYNKYGLAEISVMDLIFSVTDQYDDGPYIFIEENKFIEKSIVAGEVVLKESSILSGMTSFPIERSLFKDVSQIAALSDIHGRHDIFINILKNHHIIDEDLNWSFGNGHLVIAGDIFDKGPQVIDSLWFVFKLEKQAKKQGGKVHYLLGNHEYMALQGRLGYLHDNYEKTSELLNTDYQNLFNPNTVLGRWLRSKSTIIKINNSLFLHGGISERFLEYNLDLDTINKRYRETIDLTENEIEHSQTYKMLHTSDSPIWYRGYFRDGGLANSNVDIILQQFNADRIIVGHTSGTQIEQLNDGRIYAIDSRIKRGLRGEILLISGDEIVRGTYEGSKVKLRNIQK